MSGLQTLLRIPVSGEIFDALSEQAKTANKPVEYLIAERLPQCVQSNSIKPIIINDPQRRRLEELLGRNFSEAQELIRAIEHALTLSVGDGRVELRPRLLDRLKSRCFGMTFDTFIQMTITRLLEEFVQLR
jgi:hypothetical protein